MNKSSNEEIAMKVSKNSILINSLLSLVKLVAGMVANSGAMISDAIHSASDVFSTFIVIIGVKISAREEDKDHRYGHERMECVAAIVLAVVLLITGLEIGGNGLDIMISKRYQEMKVPGMLAFVVAIISIITKEGMFWYTKIAAKKINSSALMADAWHHRSDALSSVGSMIGIGGAMLGYRIFDPAASVVICIFIIKAAYDIFKDAISKMVDESCSEEVEQSMKEVVLKQEGVKGIDMLKTRQFGDRVYVDIEISADGNLTLIESHNIAESVHNAIEENFKTVKHCMVHVNPYNA